MVDGFLSGLARGGGGRLLPTIAYAGSIHPKELLKGRENSCFVIYSYIYKTVHLHQLKGMQCSTLGM